MSETMLDRLEQELLDSIQRVKSCNDPNSDENEKMSPEQAKAISGLASGIIDSYKVKAQVMQIVSNSQNPQFSKTFGMQSGLLQLHSTESEK